MDDEKNWQLQGACRDEDPELFFPVGRSDSKQYKLQTDAAKAVCNGTDDTPGCPVRTQCLIWALNTNQEAGIWGGASEEEISNMLRPGGSRRLVGRNARPQKGTEPCPVPVTDIDKQLILDRLDSGATVVALSAATGIPRRVCHQVWRSNRSSKNPRGVNDRTSEVSS